uniref:EF-hand domain-containing protein n=1 Tax=Aureoumbra lagunensis TaxID=44058 RepID=A0A7S3NR94_9STRA
MIEGIFLFACSWQRFGYESTLWYWLVTSIISWLLCGLFTRGRNEEFEELLNNHNEIETTCCIPSTVLPTLKESLPAPGVRRTASGSALEIFAETPRCEVNPWINATWRVTAAERIKMSILAPWLLPARIFLIIIAIIVAILFANLATLGWDGTNNVSMPSARKSLLERAWERFRRRRQRLLGKKRISPGGGVQTTVEEASPLTEERYDLEAYGSHLPPETMLEKNGSRKNIKGVLPDAITMPTWRLILGSPCLLCVRCALLGLGFWRVRSFGRLDKKARVVVCNHVSMIEPLLLLLVTRATPVASADFARLPGLGPVGRLYQLVWLDRSNVESRQAAVDAIRQRTVGADKDKWPPVLVFPEGTTLNGRALISFKTGAFQPGAIVQPVVATFPYRVICGLGLDCSWTTAGPQFGELCIRMILQPWNRLELRFLDPHHPTITEREDPQLFANNVRAAMATALRVPTTDHSWADMWLNLQSKRLGEPPHKTLVSLGALRNFLGGRIYARERAKRALECFARADTEKDGKLTLDQFRAALRADEVKAYITTNQIPTVSPDNCIDTRQLLDEKAIHALFSLLSRDTNSIDFFSFLVGFALLDDHDTERDNALRIVFELLDTSGEGVVSQSRVCALFAQVAASPTAHDYLPGRQPIKYSRAPSRDDTDFVDDDAFVRAASSQQDTFLNCEEFVSFVNTNRREFASLTFLQEEKQPES